MKPKEGTILTVAKSASLKARELADAGETDLEKYIGDIIERADYVLSQTPEMLPVLKQAGVVDSGGQGLMQVLKGAYEAFLGKEIDWTVTETAAPAGAPFAGSQETVLEESDIKFGYCTEFIIMLSKTFNIKQEMDFKAYLESIGDSIVVVADDDVVKVHVHTNDPGLAIQKALKYGALSNMKIDNMRLEHHEKVVKMAQKEQQEAAAPAEKKAAAFIAVSVGEGINAILKDLGVDYIIEGGQTMNPSTEDVLNAIEKVNAETVYVLPNNKNIILAANQAKYMTEDKKIVVIPTKTIAQGITAVINYVPDLSPEENEAAMTEAIETVRTGEVTYAVRDTVIDDHEIHQGDYMGIGDAGILAVGQAIETVTKDMIDSMMDEDMELISIYYGQETKEEDAAALRDKVAEKYPACDVELQYGGQPIYYYIVSAEGGIMEASHLITEIKGVGVKTTALFSKLHIETIKDLISYFPRGYDHYEEALPVGELCTGKVQSVRACIVGTPSMVRAKGMVITHAQAGDASGRMKLTWFRMPYLKKALPGGSWHVFRGMVQAGSF